MSNHPSDSSVQAKAESKMLSKLQMQIDCSLSKKKIRVDKNLFLEVDGYSEDKRVLCEAYAHIGDVKGAQYQKVLTDTMKMLFAEKLLGGKWRKIYLFADKKAAKTFESGTWYAKAMSKFGIEVKVVALDDETRGLVLEAQKKQAQGISVSSK
jgi:hypothetical protein